MMKLHRSLVGAALTAAVILSEWFVTPAQGAPFTYQGRLDFQGQPACGVFDFAFGVYDSPNNPLPLGSGIPVDDVVVSNGLFTVTLEFDPNPFTGPSRWLQVNVRPGDETGNFTQLTPRQPINPTPYAITALSVPAGSIGSNQLGAGVVSAANLAAGAVVQNLAASGASAVGAGGIILSEQINNTNLTAAGYTRLAQVDLVPEVWARGADAPAGSSFGSLRRRDHTMVWTGTELIIWGGRGPDGTKLNSGARYNPVTDTWTPISNVNAPSPRYWHSAVWTGTEMMVWGGGSEYGSLNTGGRYNPITDSWTALPIAGAPTVRGLHTAVWTGTDMIVWGGANLGSLTNSGARYRPSNNTWTPMTLTGAPQPRRGHTAVWTGTEMIVWGGYGVESYIWDEYEYNGLDDGARYNPANNTWSTVTSTNHLGLRYGHTAVWTGTEMIIWGGTWKYEEAGWWGWEARQGASPIGSRYNPANNTWTAIPATNLVAGRYDHTAVWTGSRMLVWGGIGTNEWGLNSGGSFNPTTGIWTALSTNNPPQARSGHAAVWTGTQMIVWGSLLELGGRYTPGNNTWTPTAPTAEASERTGESVVWTGQKMLLWGGVNWQPLRDTWSYTPARSFHLYLKP